MTALVIDTVPAARLLPYRQVVMQDRLALDEFYRWAQRLALSLFSDISVLEVAMRSSMAQELHHRYGPAWYSDPVLFDDAAVGNLSRAWDLNGLQQLADDGATPDVLEGKLVAGLMFGFWVQLLGRGSWAGKAPLRRRRIYDQLLWTPALSKAFPHAPSRDATQRQARRVQAARNRVAHHEHIVWGIPLPGQRARLAVTDLHQSLLELAGYLGASVRECIEMTSELKHELRKCPVDPSKLLL